MTQIALLGYGTIGKCILQLLLSSDVARTDAITVIDKDAGALAGCAKRGVRAACHTIQQDTIGDVLGRYAGPGDILLNLSASVDCLDLANWCQARGVMYIDTAFEPWDEDIYGLAQQPYERTMYWNHHTARANAATCWRRDGPSALFSHGANPGLVSHFAKAAVIELANAALGHNGYRHPTTARAWGELARALDVRVIHIAERDTQITSRPKQLDEFVNTWSVFGFIEEACRPAEIGWGTHEAARPRFARDHTAGSRNCLYLPVASCELLIKSWVPLCGQIEGLALPHSESVTISDHFTLRDGDDVVYRPTVVYSYLPCDAAMASLHEVKMNNWRLPERYRIMNRDIVSGADELGVLVLSETHGGWWYGSHLDIRETRGLVDGSNATALQVAAGAFAAVRWLLENPARGYLEADDVPYEYILAHAGPYLGTVISVPTDWTPFADDRVLYEELRADAGRRFGFGNFIASAAFKAG